MATGSKKRWSEQMQQKLLVLLSDRKRLEIVTVLVMVVAAAAGVFYPLHSKSVELRRKVDNYKMRLEHLEDIDRLNKYLAQQDKALTNGADVNWWLQHILDGIRKTSVKLRGMEHRVRKKKVENYEGLLVRLEVEGSFENLYRLVEWLETESPSALISKLRMQRGLDSVQAKIELSLIATWRKKDDGASQ